jgi:hypothetical protein
MTMNQDSHRETIKVANARKFALLRFVAFEKYEMFLDLLQNLAPDDLEQLGLETYLLMMLCAELLDFSELVQICQKMSLDIYEERSYEKVHWLYFECDTSDHNFSMTTQNVFKLKLLKLVAERKYAQFIMQFNDMDDDSSKLLCFEVVLIGMLCAKITQDQYFYEISNDLVHLMLENYRLDMMAWTCYGQAFSFLEGVGTLRDTSP